MARILFLGVIIVMVTTPVFAQGDVIIMDETGALDIDHIHQNAQPLLERGASVAVYMQQADADILPVLEADGLAQDATLPDDLIVIYVALNPRVTRVLSGRNWSQKLENRGEYVRDATLNRHLDDRDYTRVISDILLRLEVALQNDEASDDTRIRLIVLGAAGLALLVGTLLQWSGIFK